MNKSAKQKNDLKPCPFCGKDVDYLERKFMAWDIPSYDIGCGTDDCYLEDGGEWGITKEAIKSIWNKRKGGEV